MKNPTHDLRLKMMRAMHFIQQPDRVAERESDVSAADWRYQTHLSKYRGVRVWVDLSKQERAVCFILML